MASRSPQAARVLGEDQFHTQHPHNLAYTYNAVGRRDEAIALNRNRQIMRGIPVTTTPTHSTRATTWQTHTNQCWPPR